MGQWEVEQWSNGNRGTWQGFDNEGTCIFGSGDKAGKDQTQWVGLWIRQSQMLVITSSIRESVTLGACPKSIVVSRQYQWDQADTGTQGSSRCMGIQGSSRHIADTLSVLLAWKSSRNNVGGNEADIIRSVTSTVTK